MIHALEDQSVVPNLRTLGLPHCGEGEPNPPDLSQSSMARLELMLEARFGQALKTLDLTAAAEEQGFRTGEPTWEQACWWQSPVKWGVNGSAPLPAAVRELSAKCKVTRGWDIRIDPSEY
jgi:hypothetical protein